MQNMKKSILIYINSVASFGGIERVIVNLANHFIEDYQVTILVKDNMGSAYQLDERIKIETLSIELELNMKCRMQRILSVPINMVRSIFPLRKFLHSQRFDIIYTALPTNGLEVYLADKFYRNKLIATEHASYYAYNNVYRKIKEFLYPRLRCISVPTTMDTEIYKRLGYNAIYIPHLSTYAVQKHQELKCKTKTIINVGRLTGDKQQLQLLQIWQKVNQLLPDHDWKLQIIGSGEEEQKLKQYVLQHQITKVEFIGHTRAIADYYRQAELFVFTSKMEGFGMVLLEAMSFGVPCISYDCPSGPRDIVVEGQNGFLIPPGDINLFAKKIVDFMTSDVKKKEALRQSALDTIKKWDNEKILEKWFSLFRSMEEKDENISNWRKWLSR
ncbi:glycosyltransferase [Streptococcus sp. 20-1249]|uniref:glycosyltransferase n=1 Tax=Streptococcus hepaticus TaxID=3349163 RepID=UPI00374863C2